MLRHDKEESKKDYAKMTHPSSKRFLSLIKTAKKGDQDPLRKAYHIMQAQGITPQELVSMEHSGLVNYLKTHAVTRRNELAKNPSGLATRILLCIKRLGEQHPEDALPVVGNVTAPPRVPLLAICDEPPAFVEGRRKWLVQYRREMEEDEADRPEKATPRSYIQSHRMVVSIGCRLGVIDQSSDTESLYAPSVFAPVIAELERVLTPANVASVLSGALRITRDLHGSCPSHPEALAQFGYEVGKRFPDQALSDEQLDSITSLLDDGTAVITLLNAPRAIEARASAPGLRPQDRLGRLSAALAWAIKLDRVGLSAEHLAGLDSVLDFRGEPGMIQVRFPDPTNANRWVWKNISAEAERILKVWRTFRIEAKLKPTLLFPGDDGKPRQTRCAMKLVYDEIEQVTNHRYKFDLVKDLLTYSALEKDPDAVEAVAEEAGIKDPRSLRRRMVRVLRKRRWPAR